VSGSQAEAEWVERVLGVSVSAGPAATPPVSSRDAMAIWQGAKDAVDQQLAALYATLKQSDIPVLARAADDIESVLAGFRTRLTTSLLNLDRAAGMAKDAARAAVLEVVAAYESEIPADKHVIGADTNPFGVTVTIRDTLGGALAALRRSLQA
jgi:hypothetical protein